MIVKVTKKESRENGGQKWRADKPVPGNAGPDRWSGQTKRAGRRNRSVPPWRLMRAPRQPLSNRR